MGDFHAASYLQSLVGKDVLTPGGKPNRVVGVVGDHVFVATQQSTTAEGEPFPISELQREANRLFQHGELEVSAIRHRRSFVAAVLSGLPNVVIGRRPLRLLVRLDR